MKRLFIGIPILDEIKQKIAPLSAKISNTGADLTIVSVSNLHLTVKFLGETDESTIPEILHTMSSLHQKPFSLSFQGVGAFPSLDKITIVWVGIHSPELTALMKKVNQLLNHIRKEERPEIPHITIARVKSSRNITELQRTLLELNNLSCGQMQVDALILYESELKKEGPHYTIIDKIPLKGEL